MWTRLDNPGEVSGRAAYRSTRSPQPVHLDPQGLRSSAALLGQSGCCAVSGRLFFCCALTSSKCWRNRHVVTWSSHMTGIRMHCNAYDDTISMIWVGYACFLKLSGLNKYVLAPECTNVTQLRDSDSFQP
jgi:hypothetical protein